MPIYGYHCNKCDKNFEILQKITEKPLTRCPDCKGKIKKLISETAFQLKGEGWYVTDFAAKPAEKKTEEKKVETKSESKKD